ncbi:MAG: alkaline phosphatase D family protein [Aquabacterium sp.]|nr:alkaline phosphatase D family protein [Aquabacterium sp.]
MADFVRMSRRRWLGTAAGAWAILGGAPAFVAHARAAQSPRFELGVASGCPRPDRVVLWTRLTGADLPPQVDVSWELADDEAFSRIVARGSETATADWAHSVHAEPGGLAPDRWYHYRFTALGQRSTTGRTRTAPAPDAPGRLRFAIASCQRFDHGHYAAWAHAAREALDLIVFLGDYIYEYPSGAGMLPRRHAGGPLRSLAQYRERYAQYKRDPALQAAHAASPWLLIWDDHEVTNDCHAQGGAGLEGEAFLELRAAAYQAYWEHQPLPMTARPRGPSMRLHDHWDWGRLARLITVDGRQFRDQQACGSAWRPKALGSPFGAQCAQLDDPARSLLGRPQEQWLAGSWDRHRRWNLLAQPTLMGRASSRRIDEAGDGRYWADGWDGYAPARRRLLEGAVQAGAENLVVLGGDVHAHCVGRLHTDFDAADAPVVGSEFVTTSIASRGAPQWRTDRLLRFNPNLMHARSDQRGYVAFALDERRLEARLMAVEHPLDPSSPMLVQRRFVVETGHPGPQAA